MRITRDIIDEVNALLIDLLEGYGSEIHEAAETWLDEDCDRDERTDARAILDENIDALADGCASLLAILDPKRLKEKS